MAPLRAFPLWPCYNKCDNRATTTTLRVDNDLFGQLEQGWWHLSHQSDFKKCLQNEK